MDFPESIRNSRFAVQTKVDQELDDSKLFLLVYSEDIKLIPKKFSFNNGICILTGFLCPQLRRSWRGTLVLGCPSVCSSSTVLARVLKFHIWICYGKIFDAGFFLSALSPSLELCPLEKIRTKSDACHILWTVHARALKFHIWIPHGKIAYPYFFSYLSYLPFWSYAPLKKSTWNLVSKISQKVFELGAWNLVSL